MAHHPVSLPSLTFDYKISLELQNQLRIPPGPKSQHPPNTAVHTTNTRFLRTLNLISVTGRRATWKPFIELDNERNKFPITLPIHRSEAPFRRLSSARQPRLSSSKDPRIPESFLTAHFSSTAGNFRESSLRETFRQVVVTRSDKPFPGSLHALEFARVHLARERRTRDAG